MLGRAGAASGGVHQTYATLGSLLTSLSRAAPHTTTCDSLRRISQLAFEEVNAGASTAEHPVSDTSAVAPDQGPSHAGPRVLQPRNTHHPPPSPLQTASPDRTLFVLHGLLGCGRNWRSWAKRLVEGAAAAAPAAGGPWRALLVDLRCHGASARR